MWFLRALNAFEKAWSRLDNSPDEHAGGDLIAIIQKHFLTVVSSDLGLEANLHPALAEPFLGVATAAIPKSGRT